MDTIDALLLTRSAHERDDGLRVVLWGASDAGPVRLVFERQQAVMFVPRTAVTRAGRRRPVALTDLRGAPVDAVYAPSQRALLDERARLRDAGVRTFEADVKPVERFLMERFVTGAVQVTGAVAARAGYRELVNPAVRASDYQAPLAAMALDIETDGLEGPLLSIATAGAGGEQVLVRGRGPPAPGVRYVDDERALLHALLEHVARADPDLLLGWNVVEFDLAYLARRGAEFGVELALGRGGERARVLTPMRDGAPWTARVPGRVVLDGIATLRAASWSFESFRLEDVAQALLGRGKAIAQAADPVAEIARMFAEDKPALAAYNLEDCRLVLDVFARADLIGFAVERQALTGLPLDRPGGSVAAFDHLYLPRLHRHGHVAPEVGDVRGELGSPGGHVMASEPGLYRNVLVLDFKSLYPSIIRTFCIDPMGLAFPGDDPIPGADGGSFSRDRHILPGLIETLWAARDEAKRRGDAARSQAIKILMNSFYGVLGAPGCRFFHPVLASSITRRGHEILAASRALLEARGARVLYGDTDSLFVLAGPERDETGCAALGRAHADALNAHWRERLAREHGIDSALEIQFETHYLRFFIPTMRDAERGSKKRYAGTVRAGGGVKVVIKGLEAVRTDWTPLARRVQRELLRRVFCDEPYADWLRELTEALRAGRLDDELVYAKRLRRPAASYVKNVPPHVQAARRLDRDVRRVRYVITALGPEPVERRQGAIDYDHYLTRQLAPAVDPLLSALGESLAGIAGTQLRLF